MDVWSHRSDRIIIIGSINERGGNLEESSGKGIEEGMMRGRKVKKVNQGFFVALF